MSDPAVQPPVALEVRGVRRVFGGVVALEDVSLSVPKGSIVGLIGPNGSGKTTLVNVISGLMPPTAGTVYFNERRISGMPSYRIARLGLARTFQVVRPFTNMTVLENVAVGAMFGSSQASAGEAMVIAQDVLERVGLASRANSLADELTVLNRKRLELARALAAKPEVIMLDEVLAGLRVGELDEAITLIREINRSGVTILIIEHVLRVIVSLCNRVVVLDRGRNIAEGIPEDVMRDESVVAAYLGTRAVARAGAGDA